MTPEQLRAQIAWPWQKKLTPLPLELVPKARPTKISENLRHALGEEEYLTGAFGQPTGPLGYPKRQARYLSLMILTGLPPK